MLRYIFARSLGLCYDIVGIMLTRCMEATAVQYIERFYITNSPMTYHPTAILKTALYFATKTENHYFRLTKYCELIGKTKPEDVLASEFLLTQGLRFTFDVRHPFRALEGAVMELMALADGQMGEQQLPADMDAETLKNKIRDAHGKAREYLKTSALLTDVYFHFTPSQIMFSTLLLASPDLVTFYLSTKYPLGAPVKLFNALQRCAAMLQSCPPSSEPSQEEIKELKKLNRKLQKCQNPEMVDLVRLNKERKREGGEEGLDEGVVKKRRLERERTEREAEELFGPKLGAIKDENGVKAMEGVESGGGGTPAE
jgi:cyclin H